MTGEGTSDVTPIGELCTCGGLIAWQERASGWDGSCMGACGRYLSFDSAGSKRPTCPCGLKERPGSCGWCEE